MLDEVDCYPSVHSFNEDCGLLSKLQAREKGMRHLFGLYEEVPHAEAEREHDAEEPDVESWHLPSLGLIQLKVTAIAFGPRLCHCCSICETQSRRS
jgi:hypothetical protein